MNSIVQRKNELKAIFSYSFSCLLLLCLISIFIQSHVTNGHYLVKRDTETNDSEELEGSISPEECEEKIREREGKESKEKDVECFEIDHDMECDDHCSELGEDKCGGSRGKAFNFQCKNPQKGDKKACCCSIQCESKDETKQRLKELYADMHTDNRGLCSSFTDSSEAWNKELKKMCSNDDRVHIARKYCLEEKKGEKYFCLKVGECRGERDKTCLGCIAHECVMEGQDEGDHIVVPEEYEKERLRKQDFDKSAVGNVEDLDNMVKKEKHCTTIKCNTEDGCNKECREYCKDHGNKNCDGNTLSYGTAVEGKQGGGKHGENKCCCQPICSGKEENKSGSWESGSWEKSGKIQSKEHAESKETGTSDEEPFQQQKRSEEEQSQVKSKEGTSQLGRISNKKLSSEKYHPISEEHKGKSTENEVEMDENNDKTSKSFNDDEEEEEPNDQEKEDFSSDRYQENDTVENHRSMSDQKESIEKMEKFNEESKEDVSNQNIGRSNQDYTDPEDEYDGYEKEELNDSKYDSVDDYDY